MLETRIFPDKPFSLISEFYLSQMTEKAISNCLFDKLDKAINSLKATI